MIAPRRSRATIESVTAELLDLVDDSVRADLRAEDPTTAVEVHFPPVRVRAMPAAIVKGGDCSTDGYYDTEFDPANPSIIYADDVAATRVRFTVLHEVGHHLFASAGAHLLDDLDAMAGSAAGAAQLEETICHRFAGRVLVPDDLVDRVIDGRQLVPTHIQEIKERSTASWEAVAVRAAERSGAKTAVVLVREAGVVSFAAASPRMGWAWWPRGSPVDPTGPLARALNGRQRARQETYRHGLSYAERLYCDTLPIHDHLAISVLADHPSDNHFDILEQPEPAWKEREEFCLWCGEERSHGWCDHCKGQYCRNCERCGCVRPSDNLLCPACGYKSPFRQGAKVCRTCEADGLG